MHSYSKNWSLVPKSLFCDWIYLKALKEQESLSKEIKAYNAFADLEFNQNKSINCKARAAAIFVTLMKLDLLYSVLKNDKEFKSIYPLET